MSTPDLERRIRTWFADDAGATDAPPSLYAFLEGVPQTVAVDRSPSTPRRFVLLAAAALLLAAAVGTIAIGTGLIRIPRVIPTSAPQTSSAPSQPSSSPAEPAGPRVVITGSLAAGRDRHSATVLGDGRVVVIGGIGRYAPVRPDADENYVDTTEIWDPATGSFTLMGSLPEPLPGVGGLTRADGSALLLPDGRVLVLPGGCHCSPREPDLALIWDPATGTARASTELVLAREAHTATLLSDGRVLIAGGVPDGATGSTDSAEVWDPIAEDVVATGPMTTDRAHHSATLLEDGRVLIIGGGHALPGPSGIEPIDIAEIWDPETGSFSTVSALAGIQGTALSLPDGTVLILPRTERPDIGGGPTLAQMWDPTSGSLRQVGELNIPRVGFTASLLTDGSVLVVGGLELLGPDDFGVPLFGDPVLQIERWDPASGSFARAGTLISPRSGHTATALPDGRVLIVGGFGGEAATEPLRTAELWEPTSAP